MVVGTTGDGACVLQPGATLARHQCLRGTKCSPRAALKLRGPSLEQLPQEAPCTPRTGPSSGAGHCGCHSFPSRPDFVPTFHQSFTCHLVPTEVGGQAWVCGGHLGDPGLPIPGTFRGGYFGLNFILLPKKIWSSPIPQDSEWDLI